MEREWGIYFLSIVTSGLAYLAGVRSLTQLDEKQKKAHLNLVGALCIGSAVIGAFLTQQGVYARRTAESLQKANEDRRVLAEINNTALLQRLGADTSSIRQEMQKTPLRVAPSTTPEIRYRLGKPEYGGPFKVDDGDGRPPRTVYNTSLTIFPPTQVNNPYIDIFTDRPMADIRAGFSGTTYGDSLAIDASRTLARVHVFGLFTPRTPIEVWLSGAEGRVTVLRALAVESR